MGRGHGSTRSSGAGGGGGFSSGIGSNRSYGMNKYEKFTMEAIKSDAQTYGNVWESSEGKTMITFGGGHYTESGLASRIKTDFAAERAKTGKSDQALAKQVTRYLTNHKTGDFFGNFADTI